MARVRALDPHLPIVVMTAWSTVPLAVAIMRDGVGDFVEKPWDNARLLATVRAQVAAGRHLRRAQRLESDARDVQRRLLSRAVPDVAGYDVGVAWRFAEQLGGDAYELAALPGGRLGRRHRRRLRQGHAGRAAHGERAGDAAGPDGAAARRPTRSARGSTRRWRRASPPTASCPSPTRCSTRRAARWPTRTPGHPPPLLLRADGSVQRLDRGGPVLGLLADARYETARPRCGRGDRLVLYTDGVVEAACARGRRARWARSACSPGCARCAALTAPEAARAVLELAVDFSGGGPLGDDATVVVVDVSGS